MVLVQKWPFFQVFFQAMQARKISFSIFYIKKTPLKPIKTNSSKSRKTDIFHEGLTHSLGPKLAIFPTFFFIQYRPGKCLLPDSRTKKTPYQAIKKRKSNSRKIDIFSKVVNPWFWSKNGAFSNFFFQAIQARKMSFTIFQSEKTLLKAVKTTSS